MLRLLLLLLAVGLASLCLWGCKDSAEKNSNQETSAANLRETPYVPQPFGDGSTPPEFHLVGLNNEPISLNNFKGKVVLLNFWATWCVPCVLEMPALERLNQILGPKGLVVLGINMDNQSKREDVQKFVRSYTLTFPIALDPSFSTPKLYGVTGFPETFFIGRDGKFKAIADPGSSREDVRIVSDRAWDSPQFVSLIEKILEEPK